MGKYRIEIIRESGMDALNIEGCKNVEKYSPEEITVRLQNRDITVIGRALNMPVLVDGNLCIKGYVKTISLKQAGKEGEK